MAASEACAFTAAARRENATQSGVSQHMRKLEGTSGVALFVRGASRVRPTPAGDASDARCLDSLRLHAEADAAGMMCSLHLSSKTLPRYRSTFPKYRPRNAGTRSSASARAAGSMATMGTMPVRVRNSGRSR